jgi:ribosomal protein S18 acetylase RimI-like enzyme
VDSSNGGTFVGYYQSGALSGVLFAALDGYVTLHAPTPHARAGLAGALVRKGLVPRLLGGESETVESAWSLLHADGARARSVWRLWTYEAHVEDLADEREPALRLARTEDLAAVMAAERQAYREETGEEWDTALNRAVRERLARRIRERHEYIYAPNGQVIWKASVAAPSPLGAEIMNIFTLAPYRGKGVATRCLVELARRILKRATVVTLAVRAEDVDAIHLYERAGFRRSFPRTFIFPWRENGNGSRQVNGNGGTVH